MSVVRAARRVGPVEVLEVVERITAETELCAFGSTGLRELATVVPYDYGVFNEVDPIRRTARFDVYPDDVALPDWTFDTYETYLPCNPMFVQSTGKRRGSAVRLSDFVDREQLKTLPFYTHVLAPLGVEYQVAFSLGSPMRRVIAFSLNRAASDFTDNEVATLELVRPHLTPIYRRLCDRVEPPAHERRTRAAIETLARTHGLTDREAEVLSAIVAGGDTQAVAGHLDISVRTVRKHLEHLYRKLNVSNRAGATAAVNKAVGAER